MKETPIIMSGNHPKLILDGTKTMTRRVIKPQSYEYAGRWVWAFIKGKLATEGYWLDHCPYGQVGSRLWVREAWHSIEHPVDKAKEFVTYKATAHPHILETVKWKPSIFMPRWASRITLEITEVRVERLQEIPLVDVKKEGISEINWYHFGSAIDAFRELWDSLNAKKYPWSSNPWVWVISFKEEQKDE